ncbi:MAG: DUF4347 domain-containing protein [Rhodobacteraceae bacterium]|nr:DUF4347 domain-containing protein [Paracoccaceae bacterium]
MVILFDGSIVPALHIYHSDGSASSLWTSQHQIAGAVTRIAVRDNASFISLFNRLITAGTRYDRIIIDTHGAPGEISFGGPTFNDSWFRVQRDLMGGNSFATAGARILFSGCNVAEGAAGWSFLTEAARCFLVGVGGQATGWTSVGFASPFSGHVFHLTGNTRTVHVDGAGQVLRREGS